MERPQDPRDLYHACGDDIVAARPVLTGDVYEGVTVIETDGSRREITAMVLDHPCSLRVDGLNLAPRLNVGEVVPVPGAQWNGCFNRMFLPPPFPQATNGVKACAAFFDQGYYVSPEQLQAGTRIVCLAPSGINLFLQRMVKHSTRLTVETSKFQEANESPYEEADLIEEWCLDREEDGVKIPEAMSECMDWLREKLPDGRRRQQLLEGSQTRSTVRRDARAHLKALRRQYQQSGPS